MMRHLGLLLIATTVTACVGPPVGTRTSSPVEAVLFSAQAAFAHPEIVTVRHPDEIERRKKEVAPRGAEVVPEGANDVTDAVFGPLPRYAPGDATAEGPPIPPK